MKKEIYSIITINKYLHCILLIIFAIVLNLLLFSYSYGMESIEKRGLTYPETDEVFADLADSDTDTEKNQTILYPANTHIAFQTDDSSPFGTGNYLYKSLIITGSALPEEEVFNVSELERVYTAGELGLASDMKEAEGGSACQGLDFLKFVQMCGLDPQADGNTSLTFYNRDSVCPSFTCSLDDLRKSGALIAFSRNGKPLVTEEGSDGYDREFENAGGPLLFCTDHEAKVTNLAKILISRPDDTGNPYYGLHVREPLLYMQSMVFTVNYIDSEQYPETDDNANPFLTYTFTMKDLEDLMKDTPEQIRGNYYGISGNEQIKNTLGLGGFSDYYEGLDLCWFLREKTGLKKGAGKAVFYGREDDAYAEIKDLGYFFANKKYTDYYLEIDDTTMITDAAPILAVSKNGYPLLPDHDHDLEGHIDYNLFNHNAESLGFGSKIGIVKNVSGPFIAGLPNLDGVYGGYHCETAGDCVRIDLYVSRADYEKQSPGPVFEDVPVDSWFYEDIGYLTEQGVISGMSESVFVPADPVTRAQFVKLIVACSGTDVSGYRTDFTDVSSGYWASPYIGWACEQGLVEGNGDGRFCPEEPVSREQMAAIIDRYIRKTGLSLLKTELSQQYSDQSEISAYAMECIRDLSEYAIMKGRENGTFDPRSHASRAEASAVIARLMKKCI